MIIISILLLIGCVVLPPIAYMAGSESGTEKTLDYLAENPDTKEKMKEIFIALDASEYEFREGMK